MAGSVIPPPLVRGGQQASSKLGPQASSQVVMPPLVRGAQVSRAHAQDRSGQEAPSSCPSPQAGAVGSSPFLCLPPSSLIVLSPHPRSKSTTSDNIPARGHRRSSWLPGHPCPVCKSKGRGSSSRALSASPMSPTQVCSSISRR